jgi:hypothetical protein
VSGMDVASEHRVVCIYPLRAMSERDFLRPSSTMWREGVQQAGSVTAPVDLHLRFRAPDSGSRGGSGRENIRKLCPSRLED